MKTVFVNPADAVRTWFVIDAQDKVLGRVAAKVSSMVRGKEKTIFAPHHELGDYVVVINVDKIVVTGKKRQDKMYYKYTGFIGGMKANNYEAIAARNPATPLELAIKGMLPKGPLGRKLLQNVKIYAGSAHPHAAQNPQAVEL